jgi:hypothetical protein
MAAAAATAVTTAAAYAATTTASLAFKCASQATRFGTKNIIDKMPFDRAKLRRCYNFSGCFATSCLQSMQAVALTRNQP